jgi:PRTRC genetic system protein E
VFVELMPLLAGCTVMVTVAREDERTLRVNIIPTAKPGSAENPALTTPLSYTGTPEELKAKLGKQLARLCGVPRSTRQHARIREGRDGCGSEGSSRGSSEED